MYQLSHSESLPTVLLEATDYLELFYRENALPEPHFQARLAEVYQEYGQTETYTQTTEELACRAKVAWRNSANCIGRIFWESLNVRDLRHLTTAAEIFAALVEHIELATNNGNIRPHHTASSQFIQHMEREAQAGRMVPADWGRIVPPVSASATEVFHREMENVCLKPNFFPQAARASSCPFHRSPIGFASNSSSGK